MLSIWSFSCLPEAVYYINIKKIPQKNKKEKGGEAAIGMDGEQS